MQLQALKYIEYDDPESGDRVVFNPGDRCDELDESRVELYLDLGIVEKVEQAAKRKKAARKKPAK